MSDDTWQASDLVAPKDRGASPFAPWFAQAKKPEVVRHFNQWDLKREAELEKERLATQAQVKAFAEAQAKAKVEVAAAPVAGPPKQELTDAELEQIQREALERGVAQGREAMRAELAQERKEQAALLQELMQQWRGFRANTAAWFDPLKRLSLAVGEQLARAHLELHPQQVHALIQHCAESLGEIRDKVSVHVNPADFDRLQGLEVRWAPGWLLVADQRLSPGSVRISTEDSEVEDLMAHRLSVLAHQLLDSRLPQVDPERAEPAVVEEEPTEQESQSLEQASVPAAALPLADESNAVAADAEALPVAPSEGRDAQASELTASAEPQGEASPAQAHEATVETELMTAIDATEGETTEAASTAPAPGGELASAPLPEQAEASGDSESVTDVTEVGAATAMVEPEQAVSSAVMVQAEEADAPPADGEVDAAPSEQPSAAETDMPSEAVSDAVDVSAEEASKPAPESRDGGSGEPT